MRWEDLERELLEIPGFREDFDAQFPYHDVSLEIGGLRADMGMTQTEFAQLVGMPQSTVARLESGRHNPSVRVLKQIAKATDSELVIEFRRPRRKRSQKRSGASASAAGDARTNEPLAASTTED